MSFLCCHCYPGALPIPNWCLQCVPWKANYLVHIHVCFAMQQASNNTPMSIIFKIINYCTVYHKIKEHNSCKSSNQSFPWSLHAKVFLNLQLNPRCILQLLLSWLFHSWNLHFSLTIFNIIVYSVILFHEQCATIFS